MDTSHTHTAGRGHDALCHLNDRAWHRYHELMRGGCPEQAEALRVYGIWA